MNSQAAPNLGLITKSAKAFQESLKAELGISSMKEQMNSLSKSYSEYQKVY